MDHEDDDPGTRWNADAREREPERMSPRQAWRAIQAALPRDVIISTDIGNNCASAMPIRRSKGVGNISRRAYSGHAATAFPASSARRSAARSTPVVGFAGDGAFGISMSEMSSIGRANWPAITMVIFRNYQWGAEKRNTHALVRRQFRRHGTQPEPQLRAGRRGLRTRGRHRTDAGRTDRRVANRVRCATRRRDDLHRGHSQPGAGRTVPPRRDEETRRDRRNPPRGHAPATYTLTALPPENAYCAPSADRPVRVCAWVMLLPGGTLCVSQTLPPIDELRPTVMRPRMVAPA